MSKLEIELSEYDAMRDKAKRAEEEVVKLNKEIEGLKSFSRVIYEKTILTPKLDIDAISYIKQSIDFGRDVKNDIYLALSRVPTTEKSVSKTYVGFDDVKSSVEGKYENDVLSLRNELQDKKNRYESKYKELKKEMEDEYGETIKNLNGDCKSLDTKNKVLKETIDDLNADNKRLEESIENQKKDYEYKIAELSKKKKWYKF